MLKVQQNFNGDFGLELITQKESRIRIYFRKNELKENPKSLR